MPAAERHQQTPDKDDLDQAPNGEPEPLFADMTNVRMFCKGGQSVDPAPRLDSHNQSSDTPVSFIPNERLHSSAGMNGLPILSVVIGNQNPVLLPQSRQAAEFLEGQRQAQAAPDNPEPPKTN